jgi:four helix bundle protein
MKINSYKDLIVWQKSKSLAIKVYTLTNSFPASEKFGLISQIQRSAVSIPANIAEGRGRNSRKDFIHYLHIALGSCSELETELSIAKELHFGSPTLYNELENLLEEIRRMLLVMIQKLKASSS